MKFTVNGSVTANFHLTFLRCVDDLAPEVFADLSALTPLYEKAFEEYRGEFYEDPTYRLYMNPDSNEPLQVLFNLSANKRYLMIAESELDDRENFKLKDYFDLKKSFSDFIALYGLDTEWLKRDLWVLLGKIAKSPDLCYRLEHAFEWSWAEKRGKTFLFEFEGWPDGDASEDYQQKARSAFEVELSNYLEGTASQFKESGSKQKTRPHNLDNVKWLVYWTVKRISKEKIIEMIENEKPSTMQETDLNEMFRELKKQYDLPYRRGKKGKTTPQKRQ